MIRQFAKRLGAMNARRRSLRALSDLTDHQLRDIGLDRIEIAPRAQWG